MRGFGRPVCLVFFCLCLLVPVWGSEQKAMGVWAVSDSVRVEPLEGHVIDNDDLLFPDAGRADLRKGNTVWAPERALVSIKGARNETVAFQLVVERLGAASLTGVRVEFTDLQGPSGHRIEKSNIELFKEWYSNVRSQSFQRFSLGPGYYPDALLPCFNWQGNLYPHMYVHPFDVPDVLNNIGGGQRNQALWVDVYIPKDKVAVPAGIYQGTVLISSDQDQKRLTVQLEVWDFQLPEESHLKPNIHTNTEINTFSEPLELKYYHLLRRHRLTLAALGYAPEIRIQGTDVSYEWAAYDKRMGKYLDGSAFTDRYGYRGPGYGVPLEFLILPFDAQPVFFKRLNSGGGAQGKEFKFYRPYPVEVPRGGINKDYETIWRNAFRKFHEHFEARPEWNRTVPVVFLLSLDESYSQDSYERMSLYGRLLKESGATRFKFRIDGWYPLEILRRLSEFVDIAITGPAGFDPKMQELRAKGFQNWFYVGATEIDKGLLNGRALSWICWKFGICSWTIWELDFNSLRAYLEPVTYETAPDRRHNGLGMLVYRGETMGLSEPVASIRLKALRRGSQDYEYFWLLSRTKEGEERARTAVDRIVWQLDGRDMDYAWGAAKMWSHDAELWEKVRMEIGARLGVRVE